MQEEVIDATYAVHYGGWAPNSTIGASKDRYSPCPIDIIATDASPKPSIPTLRSRMADHLAGNYGVNMFYCFRSREEVAARSEFHGFLQEYFLSTVSEALFGERTVYRGPDYPRLWGWP
jgi:hypothetical protein